MTSLPDASGYPRRRGEPRHARRPGLPGPSSPCCRGATLASHEATPCHRTDSPHTRRVIAATSPSGSNGVPSTTGMPWRRNWRALSPVRRGAAKRPAVPGRSDSGDPDRDTRATHHAGFKPLQLLGVRPPIHPQPDWLRLTFAFAAFGRCALVARLVIPCALDCARRHPQSAHRPRDQSRGLKNRASPELSAAGVNRFTLIRVDADLAEEIGG